MIASDELTIVFTDSGLGGLSSFAKLYYLLRKSSQLPYKKIDLLFFNALPESGAGYGKMKEESQKVGTFNRALNALQKRYSPNKIAIACNTLSAVYPKTSFSSSSNHTLEIISSGRKQIEEYLKNLPEIPLLILATPTTINSGAYYFENKNILPISGDNLASLIEADFQNNSVKDRVREMLHTASNNLGKNKTVSLFFGCTHYGLIKDIFFELSKDFDLSISNTLDPQDAFIEKIMIDIFKKKMLIYADTKINLKIESQAVIEPH